MLKIKVHETLFDSLFKEGHHIHASTVVHGVPENAKLVDVQFQLDTDRTAIITFLYDVDEHLEGVVVEDTIIWAEGIPPGRESF